MSRRKPSKPNDRQAELGLDVGPRGPTLKQKVDYYLRTYLALKRKGTQRSQRALLRALVEDLAPYPTPGEVSLWVTAKLEGSLWRGPQDKEPRRLEVWQESTIKGALGVASHVCIHARHHWAEYVCPDPFDRGQVTRPVPRIQEARHVPPEVFVRLFEQVPRNNEERAALCLLYYQGLRRSELTGLEEGHVNLHVQPHTVSVLRQRKAGAREAAPLKGSCSAATLALHPETALYLRRYLPERRAELAGLKLTVAGVKKKSGYLRRSETAQRFLFAWSAYTWSNHRGTGLIDRCRQVAPEYFPKTTKGAGGRGGVASHAFRHSLGVAFATADVNPARAARAMRHRSGETTELSYYRPHKGQVVDPAISAEAYGQMGAAGVEAQRHREEQDGQQDAEVVQLASRGRKRIGK